ncbi:hypothetical protein Cgig2_033804 [Carnegiea gigantea]|uniref:Uncharacterized protein n=1 Tax=Carnegiea gigantea TaxID=171969 RepID=A0A9Q1GK35_9CARY|nr:hypothetical protein Cgig2_033804 [Carnegiea gigantea]
MCKHHKHISLSIAPIVPFSEAKTIGKELTIKSAKLIWWLSWRDLRTARKCVQTANRDKILSHEHCNTKTLAARWICLPFKLNSINRRIQGIPSKMQSVKEVRTKEKLSISCSETINTSLSGLMELYACLNEFLTQQALSLDQHEKCLRELLRGICMFLNICSAIKEIALQ